MQYNEPWDLIHEESPLALICADNDLVLGSLGRFDRDAGEGGLSGDDGIHGLGADDGSVFVARAA